MRNSKVIMRAALAVCLAVVVSPAAHAFFPFGGFNQYTTISYAKWSWGSLNDANNDRDISGPNEGLPIMFEGGPLGWTDAEIEILKDAFRVWQDVPTSYIGFHFTGVNQDPLTYNDGTETFSGDLINYMAIELPEDPVTVGVGDGILGLTLLTYSIDDAWLEFIDGAQVYVTGGQILEADIVIDGAAHRVSDTGAEPMADLLGTMVHEVGHLVGLGHTPLNNLEMVTVGGEVVGLLESPAVMLSDATGVPRMVGATPTMFPVYFEIDDGEGGYKAGDIDLAPDDIAGLSFLYPRGSQSNFFTITHQARSRTRNGFPSVPLGGAHIVAWCDTDNDPYTRRIPLFSTMSGMYEIYPANTGRFILQGLYKNLESGYGGAPFQATYTLTSCPLNNLSLERQSPPGYEAGDFDSIDGGADAYIDPIWPSEVFHETGNVLGIEKYDVGTIVTYDTTRGGVVSVTTGKSLAAMLPSPTPMFGDANQVCPYNVAVGAGLVSQATSDKIRALRDNVLLKSSVGTLAVDCYYRLSPTLASCLARHQGLMKGVKTLASAGKWIISKAEVLLGVWIAIMIVALWRRKKLGAAASMLLVAGLLMASPAQALVANLTEEEMVQMSDDIITGKVTAVNSTWQKTANRKYLVTTITVQSDDAIKATVNKHSPLALRVPGGRKGPVVTKAVDFPEFKVGEDVMLYVKYQPQTASYSVVAGNRGKYDVHTDATGTKYVLPSSIEGAAAFKAAAKAINGKNSSSAEDQDAESLKVPLEDYKIFLRTIANRQKKN